MQEIINRAKELLADGTVVRVLGWRIGDLPYNPEPSYFETAETWKRISCTTASAARTSAST